MINKKQLDILASDKRFKLYDGHRGACSKLMTPEELEILKQSFTPNKFKELYLEEYIIK
jgi:hypothetical protein